MSSNPVSGPEVTDREYPERPIVAVGGVVIHEGHALLIRRGQPPLEGRWSIPGGLKEEAGIRARPLGLIEIYEKVLRDAENRPQYHFVILDYLCEFVEGAVQAGGDVTEAAWISEADLEKLQLTAAALRVVKKAFVLALRRNAAGG